MTSTPVLALQAPSNSASLSFTYSLAMGPLRGRTTAKPVDDWTAADAQAYDFTSGHLILGDRREVHGRPLLTTTLLRQPAARLVSEFNYVHGAYHDRRRVDGKIMEENPELAIGDRNPALKPAARDLDCWIDYVAETGTGSMVEWLLRWSGLGTHGSAPAFLQRSDWFERLTGWLDSSIDQVLITELIEEGLFTVTRAMAIPPPIPWARMRPFNPTHRHVSEIGDNQRQRIDAATGADLRLYQHYRDRFEAGLQDFVFDDYFLKYRAYCHSRDANMQAAFLRRDYTYLPNAIRNSRDLLRRYTIMFGSARKEQTASR